MPYMKHIFQRAVVIVLAMVGGGAVLLFLLLIAKDVTIYDNSPADLLPAKHTVLLLHNPDQVDRDKWSAVFPEIATIEAPKSAAIAVVRTDADTTAAVLFTHQSTEFSQTLGPYEITVTDGRARSLTGMQVVPLSKSTEYALLSKGKKLSDKWTFAKKDAWPRGQHIVDDVVQSALVHTPTAAGIDPLTPERLHATAESAQHIHAPSSVALHTDTFFLLTAANGNRAWEALQKAVRKDHTFTLEGLLRNGVLSLLGPVSFESDVLGLLKSPFALQLVETEQSTQMILEGSVLDRKKLRKTLNNMHEAYSSRLPNFRVSERTLDKRFSTVDIRHDASARDVHEERIGSWTLQVTKHPELEEGLFTAHDGSKYIVTTHSALVETALTKRVPLVLPGVEAGDTLVMGGTLDIPKTYTLLKGLRINKSNTFSVQSTGSIVWSTVQNGLMRTVTVDTLPKPIPLDSLLTR